jgi:transcriptional antiterminator NusG
MADENNSGDEVSTEEVAGEQAQAVGETVEQVAAPAASEADVVSDAEAVEPVVAEGDEAEQEEAPVDPADLEFSADDIVDDDYDEEEEAEDEDVSPLEEFVEEAPVVDDEIEMNWYILKVQVNREKGICEALKRQVAQGGMEHYFSDVLVPTEDVREFTKAGKQRITKRKLYPGYIVVRMAINDDSWFLVRETSGIGDFAGASGSPVPLSQTEIDRILQAARPEEQGEEEQIKTAIPFKVGERVRIKEGYFQNYEGDISSIDERNGRIEVMIDIFGRPNPVDMDHWHAEKVN